MTDSKKEAAPGVVGLVCKHVRYCGGPCEECTAPRDTPKDACLSD